MPDATLPYGTERMRQKLFVVGSGALVNTSAPNDPAAIVDRQPGDVCEQAAKACKQPSRVCKHMQDAINALQGH